MGSEEGERAGPGRSDGTQPATRKHLDSGNIRHVGHAGRHFHLPDGAQTTPGNGGGAAGEEVGSINERRLLSLPPYVC